MSVDERLREAFALDDTGWDALAPAYLQRVHARRRRDLAVRRGVVGVGLVAAATVAAAVLAPETPTHTAPDPGTSISTTPPASTALTGEWRTDPITPADVRGMLRDAGLDAYADDALATLPDGPFHLSMSVAYDGVDVDLVTEGGSTRFDEETLTLTGGLVVLRPRSADGRSVHRWALVDGVLELSFVSTSEQPVEGVPAEVWQRIIYDTADFHR
jgi:hypothetical protein